MSDNSHYSIIKDLLQQMNVRTRYAQDSTFKSRDLKVQFRATDLDPTKLIGGGEGVRTPDLRLAKPALCQTELRPQQIPEPKIWLRGRDLNPRPLGYEPNELPDCSTPRQRNSASTGGPGWIRTTDLTLIRRAL